MPYKSIKQEKFMNAAADRGEISKKTVNEFNKASQGMKLPEKAPLKAPSEKKKPGPKADKEIGSLDELKALVKKKRVVI